MKTIPTQSKMKVKTGDTVKVLRGKDRGKSGKVVAVLPQAGRVVVEGLNMVMKHVKARRATEKGQRVSIAAPLNIANVQVICPACKKATRVAVKTEGTVKSRYCKKCNAIIDAAK